MELWERNVEARLRRKVMISEHQYSFILGKSTTDSMFALIMLMDMYREAQKLLLVDLDKAYDRMVVNLSTVYGLETVPHGLGFLKSKTLLLGLRTENYV